MQGDFHSNVMGSSPHTWGVLKITGYAPGDTRIIPTYVGSTIHKLLLRRWFKDHPHIRGEYAKQDNPHLAKQGSSPHTWGVRTSNVRLITKLGIIPTYVGSTRNTFTLLLTRWDHPHIRGEYYQLTVRPMRIPGSSPHTWGVLQGLAASAASVRIIPTYVGSTVLYSSSF